jgi:rfaE bifunctional protein kinase chain/domain
MDKYSKIIDKFKGKKILVLGDFILDEYVYGETERISREAPVLILKYNRSTYLAGGGANPVMNIVDMGGTAIPVSIAGKEEYSDILVDMMTAKGVDTSRIVRTHRYSIPVKTRVMAGSVHTVKQQVVRIDRYNDDSLDKGAQEELIANINAAAKDVDVILVSDYGSGMITDSVIKTVNALAKSGKKVVVDSRYGLKKYKYVVAATPNETEAGPAVGHEKYGEHDVELIVKKLWKMMKAKGMIVTRGSKGMIAVENGKVSRIAPFGNDEIVDVSGAGDTVSSIVCLALACGASLKDAAFLANIGGGLVVMKRGVATVTVNEIKGALKNAKA